MINMQRAPLDKVVIMQDQMGNVNKEMETPRKKQKEMLEIKKKKSITVTKNSFYEIISGLAMVEQRISEIENISIESLKIKK